MQCLQRCVPAKAAALATLPVTPVHRVCLGSACQQAQPTQASSPCLPPQRLLQRHRNQWMPLPPVQAFSSSGSSSSSSGSSGGSSQQNGPGWLGWFDRLAPRTQLMIIGGLLFGAMVVVPFLQPTFLYGDNSFGSSKPGSGQITEVQQAPEKYELPRYIPGASELYSFLQDNSMPRTLPDGRTESPGVFRIYMSSMIILAMFYACSAVVSLILRGVTGILRAVGVMGPAPPPKPEDS